MLYKRIFLVLKSDQRITAINHTQTHTYINTYIYIRKIIDTIMTLIVFLALLNYFLQDNILSTYIIRITRATNKTIKLDVATSMESSRLPIILCIYKKKKKFKLFNFFISMYFVFMQWIKIIHAVKADLILIEFKIQNFNFNFFFNSLKFLDVNHFPFSFTLFFFIQERVPGRHWSVVDFVEVLSVKIFAKQTNTK